MVKKIIVYDTDKGFTKECALFIHEKLEEATLVSMTSEDIDFKEYDEVYIGTYIIKGNISKFTRKFLKKHYAVLLNKKLKIFVSALDKADYDHALQKGLHPEIFYRADIINSGGRVLFDELTMVEKRKVMKFLNSKEDFEKFNTDKMLELIAK